MSPLQDVVAPGTPAHPTTMEVRVFMQQSKDSLTAAMAAECKDKFLIQSTPVPSDWVRAMLASGWQLNHPSCAHNQSLQRWYTRIWWRIH
jgi:hypothetical protein